MKTVIINRRDACAIPPLLAQILPYRLTDEIHRLECGIIEEIRLRRCRCASLTCGGNNVILDFVSEAQEMDAIVKSLCCGSLYAHAESMTEGYISLPGGIRAGICGRAAVENGRVIGVGEVSSIVIRLPHRAPPGVGCEIASLVRERGLGCGVLIYSKPGVGKTTVLRGTAAILASGDSPLRVAVVDTRGELSFSLEPARLTVDILTAYPRREGISIAARTLGAQVIVCDEIGDSAEADAIISAHNCGVPLIASAHAASLEELMAKPGIARLHKSRAFGAYVGLRRREGRAFEYEYSVSDTEAADACF
ncbi:MAG: hypothetical protein IJY27_01870 [Clostridia bacterium]|nr:hypothetical protein [Clostridia bacterium]